METTEQKPLTAGPVAENLLNALRALETTRNYYYLSTEPEAAPELSAVSMNKAAPFFDGLEKLLLSDLSDLVHLWATSTVKNEQI